MTCSTCKRDARDSAVAYYTVPAAGYVQHNGLGTITGFSTIKPQHTVKCWTCLTPAEKAERDPGNVNPVRFELKTLRTQ